MNFDNPQINKRMGYNIKKISNPIKRIGIQRKNFKANR